MKIYKSNTGLAISVTLDNGRNRYVSFDSISDGTAYCYVTDKRLMKAIEEHPYFGTNISIYYNDEPKEELAEEGTVNKSAKKAEETETISAPAEGDGSSVEVQPMTAADELEADAAGTEAGGEMSFECFDDAREYLNEKYGIAKKKLMSKAMVIAEAEALGITIRFND